MFRSRVRSPRTSGILYAAAGATAAALSTPLGAQCLELERLTNASTATFEYSGHAVAIAGDVAVVGSPGRDANGVSNSGAADVYRFDGSSWQHEATLTASDAAASDQLGFSVGVSGDMVAVGAPTHDSLGLDAGAVYVYRYRAGAWSLEKKLTASNGAPGDQFGYSLAIEDNEMVIGAPFQDFNAVDSGSAYAFNRPNGFVGWQEIQKLNHTAPASGDQFGNDVALGGEVMVAGAWHSTGELVPNGSAAFDHFGTDVDIDHTLALVAANASDLRGPNGGMVWSFRSRQSAFFLDQRHVGSTVGANDQFGTVAVDDVRAVMGSSLDDFTAVDSGEAFIFSVKEFVLAASPTVVSAGQQLDFASYCGTPNTPCFFAVLSIDAVPVFRILFKLNFANDHRMAFSTTVPPGLEGSTIVFETFKFGAWGQAVGSTLASVQFN